MSFTHRFSQASTTVALDVHRDFRELERLMPVPGVNVIVAATFMAAVGDIRRSGIGAS